MPDRVDLQAKRLIGLFEEAEKGIAAEIRRISGSTLTSLNGASLRSR